MPLDATQEMLTLGLSNVVGSFFQSMPVTGSFSRSAVSNASGVRTPLGGMYTGKTSFVVSRETSRVHQSVVTRAIVEKRHP